MSTVQRTPQSFAQFTLSSFLLVSSFFQLVQLFSQDYQSVMSGQFRTLEMFFSLDPLASLDLKLSMSKYCGSHFVRYSAGACTNVFR